MPRKKYAFRTSSREVFKKFQEKHPEETVSYTEWCNILYTFNYAFRDYCLETGHKIKFPYGFGEFCITKYKPKRFKITPQGQEVIGLPVDWKRTREVGKKIYHMNFSTEGFKFRWYWDNRQARFAKAEIWSFKPSRVSSRLIKHYIEQDYQHKYLQWKL